MGWQEWSGGGEVGVGGLYFKFPVLHVETSELTRKIIGS